MGWCNCADYHRYYTVYKILVTAVAAIVTEII